jgi:hypothetical protein
MCAAGVRFCDLLLGELLSYFSNFVEQDGAIAM